MNKIIIGLDDDELKMLNKFAVGNKLTLEKYAGNIVRSWLQEHIKGFFAERLKEKSITELKGFFGEPV